METQVQLITSSNVLMAAALGSEATKIPSIRSSADPEVVLRKMIQVKILPRSFLINVSTTAKSSIEAAAVVNAVVNSYLAADTEWSEGMTKSQIKNLDGYRAGLQSQVDEKQNAWLELAARGNAPIESPTGRENPAELTKTNISIEEYKRVRSLLLPAQLELAEAEASLEYRELNSFGNSPGNSSAGSAGDVDAQVAAAFRQNPDIAALADEIEGLKVKLAMVNRIAKRGSDPAAKAIERQLASLNTQYSRLWKQKYRELKEQIMSGTISETGLQPSNDLKIAAERVAMLRATIGTLDRTLAQLDVVDREHNSDAVKSAMVQSDLKRLEEMRTIVDRRLEQLRFEARGQARVRRISEALPPTRPSSDKRPKLLAMAPMGVFALIFAAGVFLEIKAGRVGGASDLSRCMGVEVFTVPPLPSIRQRRSLARRSTSEELLTDYVHRLDHLREALCGGLVHGAPGRCLLITSAVGGEGKTTLASQLAVRCANAGASTLLIDCDLRRPVLSQLLDVPEGVGLSDVLKGEISLEEALVRLDHLGFIFLPAGLPEANPARVILGQKLGPMLERLRQAYEIVIIDSPPVLPVPDALTLGRFVDGAILATRYDSSRTRLVESAHQALRSAGIPVLGVVVNGIQSASHFGGAYTTSYAAARSSAVG